MEDKKELLDRVSAFILDCDGVVWRGDKVIEGVPETLDWLRAQVCASASPAFCVKGAPNAEPAEPAMARRPVPAGDSCVEGTHTSREQPICSCQLLGREAQQAALTCRLTSCL